MADSLVVHRSGGIIAKCQRARMPHGGTADAWYCGHHAALVQHFHLKQEISSFHPGQPSMQPGLYICYVKEREPQSSPHLYYTVYYRYA